MKSKILTLNVRDFIKGLVLAIITAVITWAYEAIQAGVLFEAGSFKKIGMVALAALLGYLVKNLLTNNKDEILTPDKP